MKLRRIVTASAAAIVLAAFGSAVSADVEVSEKTFPDEALRNFVKENYDVDEGSAGVLTDDEIINAAAFIYNAGDTGPAIKDFTGLDKLTNISLFWLTGNPVSTIDLSADEDLSTLVIKYCGLEKIDLSKNKNITDMDLSGNSIREIDLSALEKVTEINLNDNLIKSLDLSKNTELVSLDISANLIKTLDISANKALKTLNAADNELTEADIKSASGLDQLKELKVGGKAKIEPLDIATAFPDKNLANYIKENYDLDKDGALDGTEVGYAANIMLSIDGNESMLIKDFTGIENLTSLQTLWIRGNTMKKLDLSKLSSLTALSFFESGLEEIILPADSHITELDLSNNNLKTIDLSSQKELKSMSLKDNKIGKIDISKNLKLEEANLENNELAALDISANTALKKVQLSGNPMTAENLTAPDDTSNINVSIPSPTPTPVSIDENFPDPAFRNYVKEGFDINQNGELEDFEISNAVNFMYNAQGAKDKTIKDFSGIELFTDLSVFWLKNNDIAKIDLSKTRILKEVTISDCSLEELVLPAENKIESLCLSDNKLKEVDISALPDLEELLIDNNKLTKLDVSKNPNLKKLYCHINELTELDLTNNPELKELLVSANYELAALDLSKNTKLVDVGISNVSIKTLNLSASPKLKSANLSSCDLESVNLTGCAALEDLDLSGNKLTAVDLTKNTELTVLNLNGNTIGSLDLSKNTKLKSLDVSGNDLFTLDLTNNKDIKTLVCDDTYLTKDDIKAPFDLSKISFSINSPRPKPEEYVIVKKGGTIVSAGNSYLVTGYKKVSFQKVKADAKSVTIPAVIEQDGIEYSVTAIAPDAFKKAKKLTKVKIGSNVKTIGRNAFSGCGKLKTVSGMAAVTTIDDGAFKNDKAITAFTIGKKVKTIGKEAFSGCKKLKTVTIKSTGLKKAGKKAFKGTNSKITFKIAKKKFKAYKKLLSKTSVPKKAVYKN